MSNIATLGLEFSSGAAAMEIEKVIHSFTRLQEVNEKTGKSINDMFNGLSGSTVQTFTGHIDTIKQSLEGLHGPVIPSSIPQDIQDSISQIAAATQNFKSVTKPVTDGLTNLFTALNNAPQNFPSGLGSDIGLLAAATAQFKVINKTTTDSLGRLFSALTNVPRNIPPDTVATINALGQATSGLSGIRKSTLDSMERFFKMMSTIPPLSKDTAQSVRELSDMFRNMGEAAQWANVNTGQLGYSVGGLIGRADAAALAMRSLAGAYSIRTIKEATQKYTEFGKELAYISSIAPELNTDKIKTGLMGFESVLGSPAENAKALYYVYSSGIRGTSEDFLKFTEIAKKTAVVNRANLIPMIDAMTAAMNAYGMSVEQAGELADNFFAIVKYGKASGEQLANSYGQVSPTAKTLGVNLDELGASIATLTKVQPTRVAITGLNNMLSKILKPTKEARLAMEQLRRATGNAGLDLSYTAIQTKGFTAVMRELHDALGGNVELIKNIFPDIRGQRAAMHLLGAGYADFIQQLENFDNKAGEMEEAWRVLKFDPNVQLGQLPTTLQKIAISMGETTMELLSFGGAMTYLLFAFNDMSNGFRDFLGSTALVISGYAALKAAKIAITSLHAMEIRNNAIINAQMKEHAGNSFRQITAMQSELISKKALAASELKYIELMQQESRMRSLNAGKAHQELLDQEKAKNQEIDALKLRLHQARNRMKSIGDQWDHGTINTREEGQYLIDAYSAAQNTATQAEEAIQKELVSLERTHTAILQQQSIIRKERLVQEELHLDAAKKRLAIEQKTKHIEAIQTLSGGKMITRESFQDTFLSTDTSARSGIGNEAIQQKIKQMKDLRMQTALTHAETQRSAMAEGNYLAAMKAGKTAMAEYRTALKLNAIEQQLNTRMTRANDLAQKSLNATNIYAKRGYIAASGAIRTYATSMASLRIALMGAGTALKALASSFLPLMAISVALEGIMWVWDKLDITGYKGFQKQTEELGKIDEKYQKITSRIDDMMGKNDTMFRDSANYAVQLQKIAELGALSKEEAADILPLVNQVNKFLGMQAVRVNDINNSLMIQTNITEDILRKRKADVLEGYTQKIEEAKKKLADLKKVADDAVLDTKDNWFYTSSGEEKAAEEAVKAVLDQENAIKSLQDEMNGAMANISLEKVLKVQQASENIQKLQEKLAKLKDDWNFDQMPMSDQVNKLYLQLRNLQYRIQTINRDLQLGTKEKDGVNLEELKLKLLIEQETVRQRQAKIQEKINDQAKKESEAIQKAKQKMLDADEKYEYDNASYAEKLVIDSQKLLEYQTKYYEARQKGEWETAEKSYSMMLERQKAIQSRYKENMKTVLSVETAISDLKINNAGKFGGLKRVLNERLQMINSAMQKAMTDGNYGEAMNLAKEDASIRGKYVESLKQQADAEKQANDKMQELIKSMNQFSVTAIDMVSSMSQEGIKLQSREFDSLPQMKPFTAANNAYQKESDAVMKNTLALYEKIKSEAKKQTGSQQIPAKLPQAAQSAQVSQLKAVSSIEADKSMAKKQASDTGSILSELGKANMLLDKILKKSGISVEYVQV